MVVAPVARSADTQVVEPAAVLAVGAARTPVVAVAEAVALPQYSYSVADYKLLVVVVVLASAVVCKDCKLLPCF